MNNEDKESIGLFTSMVATNLNTIDSFFVEPDDRNKCKANKLNINQITKTNAPIRGMPVEPIRGQNPVNKPNVDPAPSTPPLAVPIKNQPSKSDNQLEFTFIENLNKQTVIDQLFYKFDLLESKLRLILSKINQIEVNTQKRKYKKVNETNRTT